jgi:hypothetical protein
MRRFRCEYWPNSATDPIAGTKPPTSIVIAAYSATDALRKMQKGLGATSTKIEIEEVDAHDQPLPTKEPKAPQ